MKEIPDIQKVMALEFDCDLGRVSVRHFLIELAKQCWIEGESFGGNRPFGNSGWQYEVYYALADAGFIKGKRVGNEWLTLDDKAGHKLILACFDAIQSPSS